MREFLKLFNTRGKRVSEAKLQQALPDGAIIVNRVPQPAMPSTIAIIYTLPKSKKVQPVEIAKTKRVPRPKPPGIAFP